jgi:spore germination cell wall hydrolase CwlJ-like protein
MRNKAMKLSNALSFFIIAACAVIMHYAKPERQGAGKDLSERDLRCLVENIFWEAKGEPEIGQRAVAYVTMNRVHSPGYPDTVCGVVWQPEQFSWTEDGRSDRMTNLPAIQKAVDVALAVSRGKVADPTGGSLNFYAHHKARPAWRHAGWRFSIGNHTFVKMAQN